MRTFDQNEYISITMHFRCNLKCVHCMIEGTMDRLKPQSAAQLSELLKENAQTRKWKGLILSGSEVTLHADLPKWAKMAKESGFEHVRIQTHGMKLANKNYCKELVDAGVDEFFISVTASDAATHDAITGVPGSFHKTMQGLENLESFDNAISLTNTVVTSLSYQHLPEMVRLLRPFQRLAQMEFWVFWPMHEKDNKNLIVSHLEVLPFLREAVSLAQLAKRRLEVKNFPECLLGKDREILNNDQPETLVDPKFWPEFWRSGWNQCAHREQCGSVKCMGLTKAYIEKFGWHTNELSPYPCG